MRKKSDSPLSNFEKCKSQGIRDFKIWFWLRKIQILRWNSLENGKCIANETNVHYKSTKITEEIHDLRDQKKKIYVNPTLQSPHPLC